MAMTTSSSIRVKPGLVRCLATCRDMKSPPPPIDCIRHMDFHLFELISELDWDVAVDQEHTRAKLTQRIVRNA